MAQPQRRWRGDLLECTGALQGGVQTPRFRRTARPLRRAPQRRQAACVVPGTPLPALLPTPYALRRAPGVAARSRRGRSLRRTTAQPSPRAFRVQNALLQPGGASAAARCGARPPNHVHPAFGARCRRPAAPPPPRAPPLRAFPDRPRRDARAGENTDADCRQSCEVTFCPCLGFADNYRRAFRAWYAPHLVIFVICTSCWFFVSVAGYAQCAPLKMALPRSPPGMPLNVQYNATQLAAVQADNVTLALMTAYNTAVDTARSRTALWLACNSKFNRAIGGTLALMLCLLLYGGARRVAMRKKFGLPGDTLNDICTWIFCAWAALCQETRTLRQNGVTGGTWGGEAATHLLAPAAVEMSAGKADAV